MTAFENQDTRPTATIAVLAMLLFALIPVIHAASVTPDHDPHQCAVCQTADHEAALGPVVTSLIVTPAPAPIGLAPTTAPGTPSDSAYSRQQSRAPPTA